MHRLRSTSAIFRFRLAALLLCANFLFLPIPFVVIIWAVITPNPQLAKIGIGLAGLALLTTLLQWFVAIRSGCPLCLTPVLARKSCVKHRHARSTFGNYRLRVALAIIFKNSFQCPYCHESTVLEVRNRAVND